MKNIKSIIILNYYEEAPMPEPNLIPTSFRAQLQIFAEVLQSLQQVIENEFHEIEDKLAALSNKDNQNPQPNPPKVHYYTIGSDIKNQK
jgi:hypothetical protein